MSRILLALAVLTTAIVGCGGDDDDSGLYAVKGKLIGKDGKPIANVRVTLYPVKGGERPSSTGVANRDGEFTLKTARQKDGAVAGQHKVVLSVDMSAASYAKATKIGYEPNKDTKLFPKEYSDQKTTPKTFEVKDNDDNNLVIKL